MRPRLDPRSERGVAAVFAVVGFVALTFVVGMSTDFGILLRYRRAMQNACDSGALAGGLNLRSSPGTAASTAQRYAETDMRQNNTAWTSLSATTQDFLPARPGLEGVRVEIHSDVATFFLRPIRTSVPVAVFCNARLTPVILTNGLVPLGLNYDNWRAYADTSGCLPQIQGGIPLSARTPPCDSFALRVSVSQTGNLWGSGNTGALAMDDQRDCFDDCPPGHWRDAFEHGSPQNYCFDQGRTPAVTGYTLNGQACANVRTSPGNRTGQVRQGVDSRCDSPNLLDRVMVLALVNPAFSEGNGAFTTEIWGFAAYELDCSHRPTGGDPSIHGGFVSFVSMQATGRRTAFDTGIYTITLCDEGPPIDSCRE